MGLGIHLAGDSTDNWMPTAVSLRKTQCIDERPEKRGAGPPTRKAKDIEG